MGHIRSEFEELGKLVFSDFKSQKPKNVRAVRTGDMIYFIDDEKKLYTSRIIRREKYSFPLSLHDTILINTLEKLGFINKERRDQIIKKMEKLQHQKEISRLSEDIRIAQDRLKKLKEKKLK